MNTLQIALVAVGIVLVLALVGFASYRLYRRAPRLRPRGMWSNLTKLMIFNGSVCWLIILYTAVNAGSINPIVAWQSISPRGQLLVLIFAPFILMTALELIPGIRSLFRGHVTVTEEVMVYLIFWTAFCFYAGSGSLGWTALLAAGVLLSVSLKPSNRLVVRDPVGHQQGGVEVGVPQFLGVPLPRIVNTRYFLISPLLEDMTIVLNGAHDVNWIFKTPAAFRKPDGTIDPKTPGGNVHVHYSSTMFPDTSSGVTLRRLLRSGGMVASIERLQNLALESTLDHTRQYSLVELISGQQAKTITSKVIDKLTDNGDTGHLNSGGSHDNHGYGVWVRKFVNQGIFGADDLQNAADDVVEAEIRSRAALVTTEMLGKRAKKLVDESEAAGSKMPYADALLNAQAENKNATIVGLGGDIPRTISAVGESLGDFLQTKVRSRTSRNP